MRLSTLSLALLLTLPGAVYAENPASTMDPTWAIGAGLEADLARRVEAQVKQDLAEAMPAFDFARLPEYAARKAPLPAPLNSRARDALWDEVYALLARGDAAQALQVVELLRDPAANDNPKVIWQGALVRAELRRAAAATPTAREAAVRDSLASLPSKRFLEVAAGLQTLLKAAETEKGRDLPQSLRSSADNTMSYPVTPEAAVGWLYVMKIQKGIWSDIDLYRKVLDDLTAKKKAEPKKKYAFATVDMEQLTDKAHPVIVGIFDSGVDPLRYNMYENPGEVVDGLDNDGNGQVDDLMGIVWDWDPARRYQHGNLDQVEMMVPSVVQEYEPYIVGRYDLRVGNDTPEARAFVAKRAGLASVEQQKEYGRISGEMGEWAHGTHVAGLATAGNRWAQVASFRFAWTGEGRIYHERGPSDQELRWERQSIEELVAWVNAHHVRVLNASLGFTVEYQEAALAKERDVFEPDKPAWGLRDAQGRLTDELDLARIHERAVKIQEHRRETWRILFDSCPDTLFVLAAGNDDHDVAEYGDVPTTIPSKHGNLLIVGAVDDEGDWASFTNFNRDLVKVYDFGVNVFSASPTGRMLPMSGTSMASPNAANTAGKILSLYPSLTPAQVKDILTRTATPIRKPFWGGIVNEPAAVTEAGRVAGRPAGK